MGELFLTVDQTPVIADSDSVPPFWGSVFNEARKALREVEVQLNPALLNAAGAAISKARRVIVLGLGGSSSTLAEEVQVRLFRYGVSVIACKDPYLARMSISTLRSDDVFISISATGRAREILDCVDLAHHYGVASIGITAPDSALANAAEIALTTRISEYPDALTPSASRFAFLMIIDLLAAATGYAMGPEARENLRRIKFNLVSERTGVGLEPLGE
ncbi:MAG: MurR/RpiR family transcriptional regulator [Sedimentitalea sp.]|uniref:MurR/RpiR family transcriptional regulator n=1 Tax=Sedimentitalea sp. TaxID=2048915 RepID=UPI003267EB35